MAATEDQYRTISVLSNKGGVITTNRRAIPTAVESVLLSRFYLDALQISIDVNGLEGFIGMCIEGGQNYLMHNINRLGSLQGYKGSSFMVSWKDAGLNTKAFVGTPYSTNKKVGSINVSVSLDNAYFVNTDLVTIQYKNHSLEWTKWLDSVTMGPKGTTEIRSLNGPEIGFYTAGETVTVRAVSQNAEGPYPGAQFSFMLELGLYEDVKYHETVASYAYFQTNAATIRDVYYDSWPVFEGTARLFSNDTLPLSPINNTPNGYYILGETWYKVEALFSGDYARVTDFGKCQTNSWPAGDPANTAAYTEIIFNSYSTIGGADACSFTTSDLVRYIREFDGKVYTTSDLTTLIPDGYYTRGTGIGRKWFYYVGGLVSTSGLCTAPE